MKSPTDVFYHAVFWLLVVVAGCTLLWELLSREEPEEFEKLTDDEKEELRRFFKQSNDAP